MVTTAGKGLVTWLAICLRAHNAPTGLFTWLLAEGGGGAGIPALRGPELAPLTRATLLLALLAIILLGVGLIVLVILGGRMVRRWARLTPPSRVPVRVPTPPPRPLLIDEDELANDPHDTSTD